MVVVTFGLALHHLNATVRRTLTAYAGQDALRASEARFRCLSQSAPIGIVECDEQGSCRYVNDTLTSIFKSDAASMLERGWMRFVTPTICGPC